MSFNQELKWRPEQGKKYKLVSALSNKLVLDVSQNHKDKDNLIVWEWSGNENQKFFFTLLGGNRYAIFSAKSNQILEVSNDEASNGARLHCGQQTKKASEYFELVPANFHGLNNAFYLKTFSCKAVDISGGQAVNQAHVIQWDFHGKDNQIWVIEQA